MVPLHVCSNEKKHLQIHRTLENQKQSQPFTKMQRSCGELSYEKNTGT